jgi:hypothetical protein
MSRISPQLLVFSYHKSGTSLFLHVMTKVSDRLGLTLANHYGLVDLLDLEPDVILLPHSVLRAPLDRPYRAIRLIRDPRDIWVSGYLYHLRCDEEWCRNTDLNPTPPIGWPQVDYSVAHWPEDWKRLYLERLNGQSYQQNLAARSLADGLDFELDGYTGCTMATMRQWKLNGADTLDVRLEALMADFDGEMLRIFDHFGFTAAQSQMALEVARSEDVARMDEAAMGARPQIYSRKLSKWRDILPAAQIARFEARHGDLIRELGYEPARAARSVTGGKGTAPAEPQRSEIYCHTSSLREISGDAGVRLSADGATIRPTVVGLGTYTFVVPSGRACVRLESNLGAPSEGARASVGVRVTEITIRSDAGEVVIAADNPALTTGWLDAEYAGTSVWRWTGGSAELPWAGVSGPAIVTVRCEMPSVALLPA